MRGKIEGTIEAGSTDSMLIVVGSVLVIVLGAYFIDKQKDKERGSVRLGKHKEQWQMTKEEFRDSQYELAKTATIDSTSFQTTQKNKNWLEEGIKFRLDILTRAHRSYISKMLKEGKPVPAKILADYPELKANPAKSAVQAIKDEIKVNIRTEVTDSYKGQINGNVIATTEKGERAGILQYQQYLDEVLIALIEVLPKFQRQGVGKQLYNSLRQEWPDKKITWGMTTPEGEVLRQYIAKQVKEK